MESPQRKRIPGEIFLLITALIWGSGFVAQRLGMDHVQPFTFISARFFLGVLSLLPVIALTRKSNTLPPVTTRQFILAGFFCGFSLFRGGARQKIGLVPPTAGKAGFITTLYIIIVPLIGLFFGRKLTTQVIGGVILAVIGLYLLSVKGGFTIERGDLAVLVGAFFWSGHILVVDHFSKRIDGLQLSAMQFFVAAILSTIATFLFETPTVKGILGASGAILYAGIIVVGMAFTFQVLGQRNTNPTIAALIMCLEAVFAAVFGYLLLHEVMTTRELLGCALMLAGVILAQLKFGEKPALQDEPAQ